MFEWKSVQNLHVVRKLREILWDWFQVKLFFLDEEGELQEPNWKEEEGSSKTWLSQILKQDRLHASFVQHFKANHVMASQKKGLVGFKGLLEYDCGILIPIQSSSKELLGSVVAYPFLNHPLGDQEQKKAIDLLTAMGVPSFFSQELMTHSVRALDESQRSFLERLVDVVAQEICVFEAEVLKREERIQALSGELGSRYRYDLMIGRSPPMLSLYSLLDKIQHSLSSVLIQGENGTGKELVARSIHYHSSRKDQPFVTLNCSAFNENLLESELFGHVKGAFTGAIKDKKGLFDAADGGTLFLDELGDMPLSMQVKLLRVLQEGTFTPVGGTEMKTVDVRVLAATHRNLKAMIAQGTFREDLYYRINVILLSIPSLRERTEDLPLLVDHFLSKGCQEKKIPPKKLAQAVIEKFFDYPWPGNIRELENEIERLIVLSGEEVLISVEALSQRILEGEGRRKNPEEGFLSEIQKNLPRFEKLKDAIQELEKRMIEEGLKRTHGNKSQLSKELGISRANLIMKVGKYGLQKEKQENLAPEGEAA